MLHRMLRFPVVVLVCAGAAWGLADDPPEASMALQDLSDAMQIKPSFNNFLDRVTADTDKLHAALQSQSAKVSDLELEKQSLQTEMQHEKERLRDELETFKQKMIAKITDLKTTNRRLEQTNMQLVATNDKLGQQLEAEKGKKELLVEKLKKMATMFNKQQQNVQMIISQNSKRLESEVSTDVNDALSAATAETVSAASPASPTPLSSPMTMPAASADFTDSDDVSSIMSAGSLDADEVEAPTPQRAPAPPRQSLSSPQRPPMLNAKAAAPAAGPVQKPTAVAQAKKAIVQAAARAKAAAVAKVHAESATKPAPKASKDDEQLKALHSEVDKLEHETAAQVHAEPATKPVAKASEDDEQLKMLRSEVEKLEQSVKTEDSAAPAASASMIAAKRSTKTPAKAPAQDSDSLSSLQQVGGMLSEAMAAGADDADDSSA